MSQSLAQHYLADVLANLRAYKKMAERAADQLSDAEMFALIDQESNSIAVVMKHMAGNMLSRWTDFLTTDGEKPDRNRDLEFMIEPGTTRAQVQTYWERGWEAVFTALEPLTEADFSRKVLIRGEEHSIVEAINRQLTHYAYHVGQIVFLAKHFRSAEWQSLSIPRSRSAEFNKYLTQRDSSSEHRLDAAAGFAADDKR